MIYLIYNILLTILLMLSSPYFLTRSLFRKRLRKALCQRMGFLGTRPLGGSIWVHAASVGEVFCSLPLLKRIKKEFLDHKIILTTMTSTGNEAAKTQCPEADHVFFFPVDHPFILRRVLKKIQPSLLLIAETELWPNLLRTCGRKKIPIILFNGRISEKSFRGYLFFKFLFRKSLKYVSLFLMQTSEDQDRVIQIGAPSERTTVVGNLKFDQALPSITQEAATVLAQSLRLHGSEPVFIAGSTHPGEETLLIRLSRQLRDVAPDLIFILAPRHLNRLEEVERILGQESSSWVRKTALPRNPDQLDPEKRAEVILLDTMGELASLYSLATVVFIGGSLVPVGGHNPLEPLLFKTSVLFGPFMFHFSEIARQLAEEGGAIEVSSADDLAGHLRRLLRNEKARREMGERGYQFLRRHQGATERMFAAIRPYLK